MKINNKNYQKPSVKAQKLKLNLFSWDNFIDDSLLAGSCPRACGPGQCGNPSEPAFCMGGNCMC